MTRFALGPQVCTHLAAGSLREWLVPDGCGGYAMGTVSGLRTRRYHALLTVAVAGPARRRVGLAALDPLVTLPSGAQVRLCTHEWASGSVDPHGHETLESFELRDGLPRWRWRIGDIVIERVLAMRHGSPSLGVVHTLVAGGPVHLAVEALCTWRDAHGERRAGDGLRVAQTSDGVVVEGAYRVAGPGFVADGAWYHGVYHRAEAARGLNPTEDLFRVGRFTARLDPAAGPNSANTGNANTGNANTLEVSAWAGDATTLAISPPPAREVVAEARRRTRGLVAAAVPDAGATLAGTDATAALALAADAFVVTTPAGIDVVAGYPWFGAWSRDTLISYEGLFLTTRRAELGRKLLRAYTARLSEGMLANTADTGHTEFNTADATLWLLHAVDRHVTVTGDLDLAAELVGPLGEVVRHHVAGTRFGIRVDPTDGLLTQGADGYALTWMDAIVDGVPVTPRRGKAVELNALWLNGLAAMMRWYDRVGGPARRGPRLDLRPDADTLRTLHATATASFVRRFPTPHGWLRDIVDSVDPVDPVDGDGPKPSDVLRPNQLMAYGLPHAPLRGTDPTAVRAVGATLLTPLGLRSLAVGEPGYQGRHRGDPASRDRAYHQGTVWPWLIGSYVDAGRAVGISVDGVGDGLVAHLGEWGIGSVSETADGDAPHDATGCPFQAWSVAELLRVLHRETTGDP